jgi:alanine racemase
VSAVRGETTGGDTLRKLSLDPLALIANLALAREWAPPGSRVRAMVKADAYGHGLAKLIGTFTEHADELGVATLEEGLSIRSWAGPEVPVFLVSGEKDWGNRGYLEAVREAGLVPALGSVDELRLLAKQLEDQAAFPIELKLDTGMGRLGIQERDLDDLITILDNAPGIRVVGVLTHFASSDEEDLSTALDQERRFENMRARFPERFLRHATIHSANSGALLQRALGRADLLRGTTVVRPGVMLYGAAPSAFLHNTPAGGRLRPVARWTTRVVEVKAKSPGDAVGYGGTWRVEGERPVRVAVLAVGYADGFRRTLGNRARVLIRGGSFPVVGRVSMDLISVLVPDEVRVGDEAVLLGSQTGELGSDTIGPWELAELCGTIPYEIWTSIGPRVERVLQPTPD